MSSTDSQANFDRWKASDEPEAWVRTHRNGWNHDDWLALLASLKKSGYWPMDEAKIGKHLECLHDKGAPMTGPLDDLIKRAGPTRRILCGNMIEYFQEVAKKMYEAGLDRRGSGCKEQIGGKSYVIDVWVFPDGTTLECGYCE
jgi:hypothetical protein